MLLAAADTLDFFARWAPAVLEHIPPTETRTIHYVSYLPNGQYVAAAMREVAAHIDEIIGYMPNKPDN